MKKNTHLKMTPILALITAILLACYEGAIPETQVVGGNEAISRASFPEWTYAMKVWPFDLLFPDTTAEEIQQNLDQAETNGANTVIFYIEEEQMYGTFVDNAGWSTILEKVTDLTTEAHTRNLKVIVYLNGLEVMAHDACNTPSTPTLYRNHPDWVQLNIYGTPMTWTCIENDWITHDMEDTWASPCNGFRDLFKSRIADLGAVGLDGVYIDQASLPGMQDLGDEWASSDPGFTAAFQSQYGLAVPTSVDWDSETWRKFIYFRHEVIHDYLGDLANTAWANGIVPFFESSSNDTSEGTLLANEPAMSVVAGIAYSPEIESEGNYRAAFRMAKFARDIRPDQPMLYLGWPETLSDTIQEFAVTIAFSGNYYPTLNSEYPTAEAHRTFGFLDSLRIPVLDRRVPYQEVALIYSVRNKDWTFENEATFNAYISAFEGLARRHIPFRIVPLETLTAADLEGIGSIVLPGVASISDTEFVLLDSHPVIPIGENGTRDEWYTLRNTPLQFTNVISLSALTPDLPFTLTASTETMLEYYTDYTNADQFFLFAFSPSVDGEINLTNTVPLTATVYELDHAPYTITGTALTVALTSANNHFAIIALPGHEIERVHLPIVLKAQVRES